MQRSENQGIHVIDNSVKLQLELFDTYDENYFSNNISLIMNFKPYAKRVVLSRPTRTLEHYVVFVTQGATTINISYKDYNLRKGHLFIIPANNVIIKKSQSNDYSAMSISFHIPEVDQLSLIGHKEYQIALSERDCSIIENYFFLLAKLIKSQNNNPQGMNHLIISLLYDINTLYHKSSQQVAPSHSDRSSEILNDFTQLLIDQEYPIRKPQYYADKLNISKGHLADTIKEKTGKTTMDWINERTILLAQAMLMSSNEAIESIGKKLHIDDAPQFSKFFKKHTGETPKEYRKRNQHFR